MVHPASAPPEGAPPDAPTDTPHTTPEAPAPLPHAGPGRGRTEFRATVVDGMTVTVIAGALADLRDRLAEYDTAHPQGPQPRRRCTLDGHRVTAEMLLPHVAGRVALRSTSAGRAYMIAGPTLRFRGRLARTLYDLAAMVASPEHCPGAPHEGLAGQLRYGAERLTILCRRGVDPVLTQYRAEKRAALRERYETPAKQDES